MSRIRSIHPGQWTDEAFVECSFGARLLALGLRNEADDSGIFEWKPTQLKMRLFANDSIAIADLLSELEETGQVRRYEVGGKAFGMIRNFSKYQSPRRPSSIYPKPIDVTEWQSFTGHSGNHIAHPSGPFPDNGGNEEGSTPSIPDNDCQEPPDGDGDGIGGEIITNMKGGDGKEYAFSGRIVRLNKTDYDRLKKRYHAIPDLDAELWNLDDHYVRKGSDDWFHRLPKSLNAKHQEMVKSSKPKPAVAAHIF